MSDFNIMTCYEPDMLKNPTVPVKGNCSHSTPSSYTADPSGHVLCHTTSVPLLRLLGQEGLSFLPRVDFEVSQHGMAQLAWLKKVSWSNDESFWGNGGGRGFRISKLKWSQLAGELKEKGRLRVELDP